MPCLFPDLVKKQNLYKGVSSAQLCISAKYLKNNASITQKKHILSFFFLYPGYFTCNWCLFFTMTHFITVSHYHKQMHSIFFCPNFGVFSSFSAVGSGKHFPTCSPSKSSPEKGLSAGAGYCWSSPSTSTPPKLSLLSLWISVLSPSSVWASWRSCERISSCMATMKELNQHVESCNVGLYIHLDAEAQRDSKALVLSSKCSLHEWTNNRYMRYISGHDNCCKLQRKKHIMSILSVNSPVQTSARLWLHLSAPSAALRWLGNSCRCWLVWQWSWSPGHLLWSLLSPWRRESACF